MKIVVLASGSEGNSTYIETENHKILFDLGMNLKYLTQKLEEINVHPREIDYVFISHCHKDHDSALKVFTNNYQPTICLSQTIFADLPDIDGYDHLMIYEDDLYFDDFRFETLRTSHDTNDSRAFILTHQNESVVYLTDTGYINQKYYPKLKNKTYYLFESNHDTEKLMNGPYPSWLKARVVGSYGHLCNQDCAYHLTKLIGPKTQKIVLMHLSKTNNTEKLALETITTVFKNHQLDFQNIEIAKQKEKLEVTK